MPGYSGTTLIKKLGIDESMKIVLINEPANYFELIDCDLSEQLAKKIAEADFFHLFVTSKKDLGTAFKKIILSAPDDAVIWISWYKKSAGVKTDITENVIREIVLPTGWVDVKVCAVSELWSGLKIVKRRNLRK